jgi:hypothetical protein
VGARICRGLKTAVRQFTLYGPLIRPTLITECGRAQCQIIFTLKYFLAGVIGIQKGLLSVYADVQNTSARDNSAIILSSVILGIDFVNKYTKYPKTLICHVGSTALFAVPGPMSS